MMMSPRAQGKDTHEDGVDDQDEGWTQALPETKNTILANDELYGLEEGELLGLDHGWVAGCIERGCIGEWDARLDRLIDRDYP